MWRQRVLSRVSWWIVPSLSTTNCEQTPGFSPSDGVFAANALWTGP